MNAKLTWKNVALGLALAVTAETFTLSYLKLEEQIGQEMFCRDYGQLKGEPKEILNQNATAYWPDIHPSNRERYFNTFAEWVEKCE